MLHTASRLLLGNKQRLQKVKSERILQGRKKRKRDESGGRGGVNMEEGENKEMREKEKAKRSQWVVRKGASWDRNKD